MKLDNEVLINMEKINEIEVDKSEVESWIIVSFVISA